MQKKDNKKIKIAEMLRVDHAGEYAAKRIYEGQLRHIKGQKEKEKIKEMAEGEEIHLKYFEDKLRERKARPTLLYPIVDKLAYGVGAVTAKLGKEAAMLCTSAVEEVIADHYATQINELDDSEKELKNTIKKFREDELEHKNTAEKYDLHKAPGYALLSKAIKGGCRAAIKLVKIF